MRRLNPGFVIGLTYGIVTTLLTLVLVQPAIINSLLARFWNAVLFATTAAPIAIAQTSKGLVGYTLGAGFGEIAYSYILLPLFLVIVPACYGLLSYHGVLRYSESGKRAHRSRMTLAMLFTTIYFFGGLLLLSLAVT